MNSITKEIIRNPYFICGVIIGCGITLFITLILFTLLIPSYLR